MTIHPKMVLTSVKINSGFPFWLTLIGTVYSQYDCEVLLPQANIYCLSPTEFSIEPPSCSTLRYSCPDGTLCTDIESICTAEGPAACILSWQCNRCPPNAISTCFNSRQYVACIGGKPDTTVKYCQASKPYCSMEYISDGNIATVCTNQIKNIACRGDCDPEPTTTVPPPTETSPPAVTKPPANVEQCYVSMRAKKAKWNK